MRALCPLLVGEMQQRVQTDEFFAPFAPFFITFV